LRWRFGRWPRWDPRYHSERPRPGFSLPELLIVIGILAFLITLLLPTINRTRCGGSNRVKCGSNLRQIGQALLLYANENKGVYPRTIYVPGQPLSFQDDSENGGTERNPFVTLGPTASPHRRDNDVTAAIFLLIRTQDITPEVFVCPSSDAEKDTYGGSRNPASGATAQNKVSFSDWRKNLSYSYANPYPSTEAVAKYGYKLDQTNGADFAIAADMNPGVGDGYDVTAPDENASPKVMQKANSRNHQGAGQNVLFGDGHVDFVQSPFVGVQRDNVYTVSGSPDPSGPKTSKTVAGSPTGAHDSVLLPALK
jgi:prepilin-type N-terminal cleavage/methylation domain-containing protein/prepilin-type processing-associated H-X9-DG protein